MTVYINHDRFSTTLYDKRDSFSFDIVNVPHMSSNIPSKPAYGVYGAANAEKSSHILPILISCDKLTPTYVG